MTDNHDDTFRLQEWTQLLWAEQFPSPEGRSVCSPQSIIDIEQVRSLVFTPDDARIPTDVMVMAVGEPERRDVNKIGGLPYRPAAAPWPIGSAGPLAFLCQFRFAESRDLVNVPADLLLVFADIYNCEFYFEWQSLTSEPLAADTPKSSWEHVVCHGFRYRTHDYLLDEATVYDRFDSVYWRGQRGHTGLKFCRLSGMKIGGLPPWVQHGGFLSSDSSAHGKQFICSISSFVPNFDCPYPWMNRSEPLPFKGGWHDSNMLYAYDGFSLLIFLNHDQQFEGMFQVE